LYGPDFRRNAQAASASRLQSGSTVQAELSKPVDVRKNKPGDEVIAKTTQDVKSDGKVVLPKGSKIVGKVTQAQARAKGQDESQLGIAFDHAILKDGSQMPVSFAIQAVGSSESAASAAVADDSAMMGGNAGGMARGSGSGGAAGSRGGLVGGVGSTAGGAANTTGSVAGSTLHTGNVAGANTGTNVAGGLTSTSQGVVGMPGLTLSSVASGTTTAGSMISSSSSNVRLDSGTRMLLRANGQ
jgi:hypothetical protein